MRKYENSIQNLLIFLETNLLNVEIQLLATEQPELIV